jgi:hypothetical protein
MIGSRQRTKVLTVLCTPYMLWSKQEAKSSDDFANILWSKSSESRQISIQLLHLVKLNAITDLAKSREELSSMIASSLRGMREHWMNCGYPTRKIGNRPVRVQYNNPYHKGGRENAVGIARAIADSLFSKTMTSSDYKRRIAELEAEVQRLREENE